MSEIIVLKVKGVEQVITNDGVVIGKSELETSRTPEIEELLKQGILEIVEVNEVVQNEDLEESPSTEE